MLKYCIVAFVLLLGVSAVSSFTVNKRQLQLQQEKKSCSDADPCRYGGLCEDGKCKCLNGTSGDRCQFIDACRYQSQIWTECGYVYGVKCEYNQTTQTHYCACNDEKRAYDTELRKCREKCAVDNDCENGAKCVDSLCRCLPGTKEDKCDVIVKCETWSSVKEMCGIGLPKCKFNQTSHQPYCTCALPKQYGYDKSIKECIECRCGYKSSGCTFENGKKTCKCDWGYAQTEKGVCEVAPCDCGPHGECHFEGWDTICDCHKGFVEVKGKCEALGGSSTHGSGTKTDSTHPDGSSPKVSTSTQSAIVTENTISSVTGATDEKSQSNCRTVYE